MRALLVFLVSFTAFAAPKVQKYTFVTAAGPIGSLTVTTNGDVIDNDFKIDDNGRGSKIKEHVELGKSHLPVKWLIEGKGYVGAPVKESFVVEGDKAKWQSLDDQGEAPAANALYFANNATPWFAGLVIDELLRSKSMERDVLPSGRLRLEKLKDVPLSSTPKSATATAYAVWGADVVPQLVLHSKGKLWATMAPGFVLVDEKYADQFPYLSKLASQLSQELLQKVAARVMHPIDQPLWIRDVHVFDPVAGKRGPSTNVVVYRDQIVGVRNDEPPAGAKAVNGRGGTLMPGLFDAHGHSNDWGSLLNIASGVTFARDPGNDNETLLALEQQIENGKIVGPRLVKSGFLEGDSPFSAHGGFIIKTLEEGLEKVRWYADHGFWGLKIYNSMNPDFVAPLAKEAHRLGMHVSGHIPAFMTSERAIRDGYDEINHINQLVLSLVISEKEDTRTPFRFTALGERTGKVDLKGEAFARLLKLMKEKHTVLDPTMATFSVLLQSRPGKASPTDATWLSHMPMTVQRGRKTAALDVKPEQDPLYAASWQRLEQILVTLHKEGIPLVPGTDDMPGVVLHAELEAWVHAGITPVDTLRAATLGGAKFIGRDAEWGTVAIGKRADLYLVDGDPTQDINAIRRGTLVVKGGSYYFPDEIHAVLGIAPFAAHAEVGETPVKVAPGR